jgi:hypothetical protein
MSPFVSCDVGGKKIRHYYRRSSCSDNPQNPNLQTIQIENGVLNDASRDRFDPYDYQRRDCGAIGPVVAVVFFGDHLGYYFSQISLHQAIL